MVRTPSNLLKKEVTYLELIKQVTSPLAEVTNTTNKPLVVNLPDQSAILLIHKVGSAILSSF